MGHLPTRPRTGFTRVELLVVLAMLGIVIGMVIPAVQNAVSRKSERTVFGAVGALLARLSCPAAAVAGGGAPGSTSYPPPVMGLP